MIDICAERHAKRRPTNARITLSLLSRDPGALHTFITVWTANGQREVLYHRSNDYPPPPAEELLGMTIKTAKKFLKEEEERMRNERQIQSTEADKVQEDQPATLPSVRGRQALRIWK